MLLLLSAASIATGAEVNLEWDASPDLDVAGYRLYYDTVSGGRAKVIDVGNATTAKVADLAVGSTYYFVATAYNTAGLESLPSNEITYTIANQLPTVSLAITTDASIYTAPAELRLSATAADTDGTVVRVAFYSGATKLGETTTSPHQFVWGGVPEGNYTLTAVAFDDRGGSTTSQPVQVVVNAPPAVPEPTQPAQPGITAVNYQADGSVQLVVAGEAGRTNSVYVSEDMKAWTLLQSATNSTGTVTITDPLAASKERRFYRVSDSVVTTDPSGFVKLRVAGRPSGGTTGFSYLGLGLTNPISHRGTVTSTGFRTIIDDQALWTENQFSGANGDYYVEITSGPKAGLMADIVAMSATNRSLTIDEDLSPLLAGGETYAIRRHRTIGDVFGKNNEAGLQAGTSIANADEIQVWNPVTQSYLRFYFQSGSGWRASSDPVADASATKLYLDQGVVVCRKAVGDLTLVLTGTVKSGPTVVPIGVGSNLIANPYPAGILTLGNSRLYVGNGSLGLTGGTNIDYADEVRIFDGAVFQRYYYKTGGAGGSGWRNVSNKKQEASQTRISAGSAVYIIRRNGRPSFNWSALQPF